jgi:predicted site-specific integrase-resolvase
MIVFRDNPSVQPGGFMSPTAAIPKYIPISQAASELGVNKTKLLDLASLGKIEAIQLPDGEFAVNEKTLQKPLQKEDLPEYKQFAHLSNETTWISQASRDYDIPHPTIINWTKDGFIEVVGKEGNKKLLNAQDVAYCAFIYKKYQEEGTQGRRIFDDDGTPYEPKSGPFAI